MSTPQPGDYLVIKSHGWAARLIQIGTRSRWNHAAIYVGLRNGVPSIVEAKPSGVGFSPLSNYHREDYVVSKRNLTSWERIKVVGGAARLVKKRTKYGWLDIVALSAVQLNACPAWLRSIAKNDDRLVCSQVVSACWAKAGVEAVPNKDPWAVTPGDLADEELVELAT